MPNFEIVVRYKCTFIIAVIVSAENVSHLPLARWPTLELVCPKHFPQPKAPPDGGFGPPNLTDKGQFVFLHGICWPLVQSDLKEEDY